MSKKLAVFAAIFLLVVSFGTVVADSGGYENSTVSLAGYDIDNWFPLAHGNWWEFEVTEFDEHHSSSFLDNYCEGNGVGDEVDGTKVRFQVLPPNGWGRFLGSRSLQVVSENPCAYWAPLHDTSYGFFGNTDGRGMNTTWQIPHPMDESDFDNDMLWMQLGHDVWTVRDETGNGPDTVAYAINDSTNDDYAPNYHAYAENSSDFYDNDGDLEPERGLTYLGGFEHSGEFNDLDDAIDGCSGCRGWYDPLIKVRGYIWPPLTGERNGATSYNKPEFVYETFFLTSQPDQDSASDGFYLLDGTKYEEFEDMVQHDRIKESSTSNDADPVIWYVKMRDGETITTSAGTFYDVRQVTVLELPEEAVVNDGDGDGKDGTWGVCETWYFDNNVGLVKLQNANLAVDSNTAVGANGRPYQKIIQDCFGVPDYNASPTQDDPTGPGEDDGYGSDTFLEDERGAYDGSDETYREYDWDYGGELDLVDYHVSPVALKYTDISFDMGPIEAAATFDYDGSGAADEVLYVSNDVYWVFDMETNTLEDSGKFDGSVFEDDANTLTYEGQSTTPSRDGDSIVSNDGIGGPQGIVIDDAVGEIWPNCDVTINSTSYPCNFLVLNQDEDQTEPAMWLGRWDAATGQVHYDTWHQDKITDFTHMGNVPNADGVVFDEDPFDAVFMSREHDSGDPKYIVFVKSGSYWTFDTNGLKWYGDLAAAYDQYAPNLFDMAGPTEYMDAAMSFFDGDGFGTSGSYEDPVSDEVQQIFFANEAVWLKYYDNDDWEEWDRCNVGPEWFNGTGRCENH